MYYVEITQEDCYGTRYVHRFDTRNQVNWLKAAQAMPLSGYAPEKLRRLIVWDLSLPRRSGSEPVRIVDLSFPDCWASAPAPGTLN